MTIEDTVDELVGAWNSGDADRWARQFTEDVTFIDSVGQVRRGRELVAEAYRHWFAGLFKDTSTTLTIADRAELADGVSLVHLEAVITMPAPHPGTMRMVATAVFVGTAITSYHNSLQPVVGDLSQVVTFQATAQ
ncbi:SgcJ/EcaC family oxidoreductase [Nocardia takedensis]|uniref:SgcJ/EcaC family oxidoreductase n=1 Tax=Nocardia takedensis TaxID=259390 RepID=UPI003F77080E